MDEESKRVSQQVSSLATQLIESVERQSKLEEQLVHLKRDLEEQTKLKDEANSEVSKLQKEVEELTASLFDEANKMVADARREGNEYKVKNEHLISQLEERDLLLSNLTEQLSELKDVLHQQDVATALTATATRAEDTTSMALYSPTVNSIRFDLKFYKEYLKFIANLSEQESIRAHESKFLKRIISEEVEPALRIDLANGIGWLSKRTLMMALVDGRVIIEPVSGINETYRLNFNKPTDNAANVKSSLYSYPENSPPVAIETPCALCNEDRNDILEHSRLYLMKVHAVKRDDFFLASGGSASTTNGSNSESANDIAHQYPLCSYCLFRVRSACELFAFLRSLRLKNLWTLTDKVVVKKSWLELSRLRSKLFWSKIGIWDTDSNIITNQITPSVTDDLYKYLDEQPASAEVSKSSTNVSDVQPPKEKSKESARAVQQEVSKDDLKQDGNKNKPATAAGEEEEEEEDNNNQTITADFLSNYSDDGEDEDDGENDDDQEKGDGSEPEKEHVEGFQNLQIETNETLSKNENTPLAEESTPIINKILQFDEPETETDEDNYVDT